MDQEKWLFVFAIKILTDFFSFNKVLKLKNLLLNKTS